MTISATDVRDLRAKTGAGMMDCKKALQENDGNFDDAIKWLRTKGLSKAAKKADRTAAEGLVTTYLHGDGRIGVLLEVNSETDFVSRNDDFKAFCKDVAMHIAAMNPAYVRVEEISEEDRNKEKDVLAAKALAEGKKKEFLDKILDGQLKKWAAEQCLLDQKFVKNPDKTISETLTDLISLIGENIVVRRFSRFELGEGIEKKKENFAEEVAAQLNN